LAVLSVLRISSLNRVLEKSDGESPLVG
jgi:hypothetical protein